MRSAVRKFAYRIAADTRGVALQTVIVIVVLIAIAGGVATVLLQTSEEATTNLEDTSIGVAADDYTSEVLCVAAGHLWDQTKTPDCSYNYTSQATCEARRGLWWKSSTSLCLSS